jgi:hypothetical protein
MLRACYPLQLHSHCRHSKHVTHGPHQRQDNFKKLRPNQKNVRQHASHNNTEQHPPTQAPHTTTLVIVGNKDVSQQLLHAALPGLAVVEAFARQCPQHGPVAKHDDVTLQAMQTEREKAKRFVQHHRSSTKHQNAKESMHRLSDLNCSGEQKIYGQQGMSPPVSAPASALTPAFVERTLPAVPQGTCTCRLLAAIPAG